MIDWNDCLPTKEMQVDFERFKELKTTEEKEAFKICLEKIRKHKLEMILVKVETGYISVLTEI